MSHKSVVAVLGSTACVVVFANVAVGADRAAQAKAHLTPSQVVPKQFVRVASASGAFSATLTKTKKGYTMRWRLTYRDLSGKKAWAYIHKGKPGKFGAALYILCSSCSSGVHGSAYVSPWGFNLMQTGRTYVTVRTKKNPAGEIRGQIRVS